MITLLAVITLKSLLLEMADPDANTYLDETPWTGRQWSSYDRRSVSGSSMDDKGWFANNDWSHFLYLCKNNNRQEWVMVDTAGPGVLTRLWCANCKNAKVRFYIDDNETPVFEGSVTNLIGGNVIAPRPYAQEDSPLQEPYQRSQNLYLPIPYAKSLKITCELDPVDGRFWYNAETRTYPKDTKVVSFSKNQVKDLPKTFDPKLDFKPLQKEYKGPAAIRGLVIPPGRQLKIFFDGNLCVDCKSDQLAWNFVMPFKRDCRIELDDYSDCTAAVGEYRWDDGRSMHFHAKGLEFKNLPTYKGENKYYELNWVDIKGEGRLVGNSLCVDNNLENPERSPWWGEGDEKIYVDGESFPSYFGTGTEDFFGYSWGPGEAFTDHPFLALPISDSHRASVNAPRTAKAYRRRRLDSIPFRKSLKLDVEVWHWEDCHLNYSPATFWYQVPGLAKDRSSGIRAVNPKDVTVTKGFWHDRIETNRLATLDYCFKRCEETGRIANFTNAARRVHGGFQGIPFNDSDVFKVMEGAAYIYGQTRDPELGKYMDWLIGEVADAQETDGYLYTARTLGFWYPDKPNSPFGMMGPTRWSSLGGSHELYNVGHMYEAAVAWYEATGKTNFLEVARKNFELVRRTFGWEDGQLKDVPGHQEIELALCRLYRATGDRRYLDQCRFFLDMRGRKDLRKNAGRADRQDHVPVLEQEEAIGHAVRAAYMYTGMADYAFASGDQEYIKAIKRIWENAVGCKLAVHGGIGAREDINHPLYGTMNESFDEPYDLPNDEYDAYNETCAAIANSLWNERLFRATGEAKYVDVLERVIYNGFASGISLSGKEFFYPNPMASKGGYKRSPWFGCSCCPVNDVRFIPQIPGFSFATKDDTVYWNLFLNGKAKVGDNHFEITTDYPWSGRISLKVEKLGGSDFRQLKIRIPGWAKGSPVPSELYKQTEPSSFFEVQVCVNGLAVNGCPGEDGYLTVGREWREGDVVTVDLPMPVKRIRADKRVVADRGRLAVEKGPVLYCAEGFDNGGKAYDAVLPADATFTETKISIGDREFPALKASNGLLLVPYSIWDNRKPGNEMQAWFREQPQHPSVAQFKPGERVLFYGDSITHGGKYIYYLQLFENLRHPGSGVRLMNGGRSGGSASDGLKNFDRELADSHPDRVFIMFGMNDVGRWSYKEEYPSDKDRESRRRCLSWFRNNMDQLTDRFIAAKISPVLMTPTPYDQYAKIEVENLAHCNEAGLSSVAFHVRELASVKDLGLVEFHEPMTKLFVKDAKGYSFTPDRVHPGNEGHLIMAAHILNAMGVSPEVATTEVKSSDGVSAAFDYAPKALPFPKMPEYEKDLEFYPLTEKLNQEIIRVSGLKEGGYALSFDGKKVGSFTAAEFAKGVNIALLDTPNQLRAQEIVPAMRELQKMMADYRNVVLIKRMVQDAGIDISDWTAVDAWLDKYLEKEKSKPWYRGVKAWVDRYREGRAVEKETLANMDSLYEKMAAVRPAASRVTIEKE